MIKLNIPKIDIEYYYDNKTYNLYKRDNVLVLKETSENNKYYFYYNDDKIYVFKNYISDNNLLNNKEKKEYLKRLYNVINESTLMYDVIDKEEIKKLIK